ncbi:flavin-containing monooxygenase [Gordonia effusa]|nr:NAD(P)/FAD-dependent oxidoreductase [Gordonia effusa]
MPELSIIIIGSGFGGLAAAIELKRAGHENIVILEKADEVGGVWRDNTYPGAACDVPSSLYSYSFFPNPNWHRRYSEQSQILRYLKSVADAYDLHRHLRLNTEVVACAWSDEHKYWTVETSSAQTFTAQVLIPAVGQLSRPTYPRIDGIEKFTGPAFHSATWDHRVDLDGKHVAVIGTGASAIQFVPAIEPKVASMTVFQRTPPYIVPRWDTRYRQWRLRLFERVPHIQKFARLGWFVYLETVTTAFLYSPLLARAITAHARRHMRKQTAVEPGLFEKVWPNYPFGCKRGLLSDTYLPALTKPHVTLETHPVVAIEPGGMRTADGAFHSADLIIYGTGFATDQFMAPITITGHRGRTLDDEWAEGAHAYYGLTVHGFPNLLLMYGPNTNTGGGSIVYFLEAQARYIRSYVDHISTTGRAWNIRKEVATSFDQRTQDRLKQSVWTMCSSWYQNQSGRITANWPGVSTQYRRKAVFRASDFREVD